MGEQIASGFTELLHARIDYSGLVGPDWGVRGLPAGMVPSDLSVVACSPASLKAWRTASWSAGRTWRVFSLVLVGFTRFVSKTMNRHLVGSIQSDVPVKPVWPKLRDEK